MSASWLADKIEQWPTAKLLPYARNARTHSEEQVAQIAASIVVPLPPKGSNTMSPASV